MGNISFGNSYLILSKFKFFPKITKEEKRRDALTQEYNKILDFEQSAEYQQFIEDEQYFSSKKFQEDLKKLREEEANEEIEKLEAKKKAVEDFRNSKKYKEYLNNSKSGIFDELKAYKIVFEDNFEGSKLDREKWTTHYFGGENAMHSAYALNSDFAFPTDGNNIDIQGGKARISLKAEKTTGKVWKLPFGFVDQTFDYTTGLMNTAKSFRGKYGKIEAKVKITHSPNAAFIFNLSTEDMLPYVDLFRIEENVKKYSSGSLWGKELKNHQKAQGHFEGVDLSQDYFLFTFIWTPQKMIWKINGETVNTQTTGIPDEEMFLSFNVRGLDEKISTPAAMDIAWVKWYQEV
jgi:hypothetical protein